MHHKSTKKLSFRAIKVEKSFTSETLTSYSGLTTVNDYVNHLGLFAVLDQVFATVKNNATKILNVQIFGAIIFASLCGVSRLSNIAKFTEDPLVRKLLRLTEGLDDSNIKVRLSKLGQNGANKFLEKSLEFVRKWVNKSGLSRITVDCDSTEYTVYGHQEGAAKGYNPGNKGKLSYHPLLCFYSEMKIILNVWFRTGSACTSNGVVEFMKQTLAALPCTVKKIFFRADSGFFNGQLFDLLERDRHEYLVKAKLTSNIKLVLKEEKWNEIDRKTAVCNFEYQANGWKIARKIYAIRIVKEFIEKDFFGKKDAAGVS